jgi:hypothetical protein
MLDIKFTDSEATHTCDSQVEGNWVVFTCPLCSDFSRRMNLETGELHTECPGDPTVLHRGMFVNPVLQVFDASLS